MRGRLTGLWRHPGFIRLWAGQTISVFGSLTTRVALPFTAIIYLDARPFEVALLTSADVMAGILFGLLAGVWVDRLPRRPIMIAADLGRASIIGSIPLAAVAGRLTIEQLYVVAFSAGVLTMFFDVAYQSYLPTLVKTEELVEGNSKLAASASVAEFGAFSAGGWLVQLVTGPGAMLVDAVSFVVSAVSLGMIRQKEPPPILGAGRASVRDEIVDGLLTVARDGVLRTVAVSWISLSFASGTFAGIFVLFVTRDLGFSPGVQGVIYGVGGMTSLFGALAADQARRSLGVGGAMAAGLLLGSAGVLSIVVSPRVSAVAVVLLVSQQVISDPGWTIYEINQISLRQAMAPPQMLGRVNAGVRFAGLIAMLTGSLLAAALAGPIGARGVLALGACLPIAGAAFVLLSPVRRMRGIASSAGEIADVVRVT